MGEFSTLILSIVKREAPDQGGLLTGKDPSAVNTADPIRLWIIQVGVIVGMASLLSLGLRKIRQPKVIAEVLGGILLGPTAFGRIPGFTEHIFPPDSIPYLSLVANIGLCLFLFLVGLEIDMSIIRRNARLSGTVALAGMIIPFGAGAGLAKALYGQFINTPDSGLTGFVKFTYFMLFTGVAYSITAFPVLCRILTELKLLDTTVGVVVLSAGVANDIIGWTLLALSVALVNAGSGLTALYILLVCVGWALILLFPGKKALSWLGRKTGSTEGHGPSMFFMTVTMLLLFGSAFFTDVIGVHAIFGAFLTGIIVPREGNLAIYLTEKLEDMVSIIFLPLYFTLSGLSTNLGLLDNGITWGYTIAICALAFTGKFGGCCLAAHYVAKFNWRESGTIGSLMSCKGLVELIVLNVGLSAGILSQRVFSMFVLEALVLTFMTTPLVTLLYPPEARIRVSATGANFNNVADRDNLLEPGSKLDLGDRKGSSSDESSDGEERMKTRFTVVLDQIEHLPGMMALTQMIKPSLVSGSISSPAAPSHLVSALEPSTLTSEIPGGSTLVSSTPVTIPTLSLPSPKLPKPINHHISALRLVELSDRTSAVMKSMSMASHPDHAAVLAQCDPMLNIYTTFAALNDLSVSPALETVPYDDLARAVVDFARDAGYSTYMSSGRAGGEMLLLPWLPPTVGPTHGLESHPASPAPSAAVHNPFDTLFNKGSGVGGASTPVPGSHAIHSMGDKLSNSVAATIHAQFVRQVFSKATVDVGLFMDLGCKQAAAAAPGLFSGSKPSSLGGVDHILLPFFGGPDDRLALAFVVQLCENEKVTATCLKITKTEEVDVEGPTSAPIAHSSTDDAKNTIPPETFLTVASAFSARSAAVFPDTVYGHANTATRMQSETADHLAWARFANFTGSSSSSTGSTSGTFPSRAALSRIHFQDLSSPVPLHGVIAEANRIRSSNTSGTNKLLVVAGRSRRLAVENHTREIKRLMEEQHAHGVGGDVRKTIGNVASSIVISGCAQEILVVQATDIDL
ncbi:Sodium/hydrogen exchanger family-domain-containing protein [Lentinula aciculospora]|uniref:Sodium/hydrogen exchanger family-domain-containing protein n=1 Tax=Lentinula aciculospora TaxID=153920 RepID=A0A9W9AN87_9AGAR|nr:Sodium/hydrogen exchanger family-domain-containing protein [Lentinula aciculospora]